MHEEKTVLLKNDMYEFENIKQDEFKTNMYFQNQKDSEIRKVIVNEYNIRKVALPDVHFASQICTNQ